MRLPRALMGRTAALTALSCAVLICASALVSTANQVRRDLNDEQSSALLRLAHDRSLAAERPALDRELVRLNSQIGSMPELVHAGGNSLAAAQVQSAVKALVSAIGGEVRSARAMPPDRASGFAILRIGCDVMIPASRLRDLAVAIETHRPYLFVDRADITAPIAWNTAKEPDPTLAVTLVLSAWADTE